MLTYRLELGLGLTLDPGANPGAKHQGLMTPHHFPEFFRRLSLFQGFARVGDFFQGYDDIFQGFGDTFFGQSCIHNPI